MMVFKYTNIPPHDGLSKAQKSSRGIFGGIQAYPLSCRLVQVLHLPPPF
jgi:hypothetical protein